VSWVRSVLQVLLEIQQLELLDERGLNDSGGEAEKIVSEKEKERDEKSGRRSRRDATHPTFKTSPIRFMERTRTSTSIWRSAASASGEQKGRKEDQFQLSRTSTRTVPNSISTQKGGKTLTFEFTEVPQTLCLVKK